MARPDTGRKGLDMASWLARKIRQGNLRGLPPFHANGGGIVLHPDPYARLLLAALRQPGVDLRSLDRVKDDARALRSWVENNQLELVPARPTLTFSKVWANPSP